MARKKGTDKTGGRVKGTPNKATAELKDRLKQFLDLNFDPAVEAYLRLDDKDKVLLYEKFLTYALPKQSAGTMTVTDTTPKTLKVEIVPGKKPVNSESDIDLTRE